MLADTLPMNLYFLETQLPHMQIKTVIPTQGVALRINLSDLYKVLLQFMEKIRSSPYNPFLSSPRDLGLISGQGLS